MRTPGAVQLLRSSQVFTHARRCSPTRPVHWVCLQAVGSRRQVFVHLGAARASPPARSVTQADSRKATRRVAILMAIHPLARGYSSDADEVHQSKRATPARHQSRRGEVE